MSAGAAGITPLEQIERSVLDQAKGIRLDLDDDAARARLHGLIEEAVAQWSDDFRRGLRTHDLADPDLVVERAFRNLVGYGPLDPLLGDDDVWEVMINAPDSIFVKRHHGPPATTTRSSTTTSTSSARSPRSSTTRRGRTASSIPPRGCRTPSSTTAPASTSSTATSPAAAT